MEDKLRCQLQQLSPAQLRELLSASGHGQMLRDVAHESPPAVDEQLLAAAKNEGNVFFRQGRLHDAISSYSRCIAMDPNNAVCLSNRAAAFLKLGQFELAVADCSKAIETAPTIKPYMRRATAHLALQHYEQAVADIIAALQFEPHNKECRTKLETIVETAIDRSQRGDGATAELRTAGVRAAVIVSARDGWSKSAVRGNPGPAAVNGHTLFRGDDGRIYLFGGRAVRERKANVFALDKNDDSSWDTVSTRGTDAPSSRAWHSTSVIDSKGRKLYCVYGGVSSRGEDPSVYLLASSPSRGFQWVQAHCSQDLKEIPAPRSGHAAASVVEDTGDRAVFIFGGRTKRGVSDQLLILRVSTTEAESDDTELVAATVAWEEVHARGVCPSARDGHSMCLLTPTAANQASRFIVFGGNGQLTDEKMNDVWLFDVKTQLWTLMHCCGDIPPPRSYHTAHAIGEFLFVIGGRTAEAEDGSVYLLDIATAEWFKVPIPNDQALTSRAWHSSVLTEAGKLFVLGGGTYHGPLKDAAQLDLSYFRTKAASFTHVDLLNEPRYQSQV